MKIVQDRAIVTTADW